MFIIGGVSPKTTQLDDRPVRCPACGLYQAHLKRTDSYLNLFFIPLFRISRGSPYVACERCGSISPPHAEQTQSWQPKTDMTPCRTCGRRLDQEFKYCPNCGTKR